MDFAIGRNNVRADQLEGAPLEVGDLPARFLDQEHPGGDVPGV